MTEAFQYPLVQYMSVEGASGVRLSYSVAEHWLYKSGVLVSFQFPATAGFSLTSNFPQNI